LLHIANVVVHITVGVMFVCVYMCQQRAVGNRSVVMSILCITNSAVHIALFSLGVCDFCCLSASCLGLDS